MNCGERLSGGSLNMAPILHVYSRMSNLSNVPTSAELKAEKSKLESFNPLHTYGDWVTLSLLDMRFESEDYIRSAIRREQMNQINAVIPGAGCYRRCIEFRETDQLDTMEKVCAWMYCPDLHVITLELEKIMYKMFHHRPHKEYQIEPVMDTAMNRSWRVLWKFPHETTWQVHVWHFLTTKRAQAWIDKQGDELL